MRTRRKRDRVDEKKKKQKKNYDRFKPAVVRAEPFLRRVFRISIKVGLEIFVLEIDGNAPFDCVRRAPNGTRKEKK